MKIISEGIHMMFINDFKGVFYPVMNVALSSAEFQISALFEKTYAQTVIKAFASYFDSKQSEWEPFLEPVRIRLLIENGSNILFKCEDSLSLNVSTELLDTVFWTFYSLNNQKHLQTPIV